MVKIFGQRFRARDGEVVRVVVRSGPTTAHGVSFVNAGGALSHESHSPAQKVSRVRYTIDTPPDPNWLAVGVIFSSEEGGEYTIELTGEDGATHTYKAKQRLPKQVQANKNFAFYVRSNP